MDYSLSKMQKILKIFYNPDHAHIAVKITIIHTMHEMVFYNPPDTPKKATHTENSKDHNDQFHSEKLCFHETSIMFLE